MFLAAVGSGIERFGNSYTIAPHVRLDDASAYVIEFLDGERLQQLLSQFDSVSFTLLYHDHRGRERRHPIERCDAVDELI